ncbi:MAG: CapA family protein [Muribaculaceae bacterium]|nr:CapA family protein [Muribaculaceae bacterium]
MFLVDLLSFILPLVPEIADLPGHGESADLLFAGDAMMHQAQIDAAKVHGFEGYFSAIKPFVEKADFAVVNFEAPLGGTPYRGYPCFSAPDDYPRALTDAGFDFFLLANNHILDRRDRGLHRTINMLDSLGIPHAGVYHDAAARDSLVPALVNVNGFRIGLLNYTYGTNGIQLQGPAVVNYIDRGQIAADVSAARSAGAELVAVCIHWGEEYKLLPSAAQKSQAKMLADLGVDMIIGGHPHVVQPMEMLQGPDGKQSLLVYSLGNLISNMKTNDTRGGALVRVHLDRDSLGQARVASAAWSPVFVEPPSASNPNFRLVNPTTSTNPKAKVFLRNATDLFDRHNINVPYDTLFFQCTK